jgi:hypothetical protein
MGAYLQRIAMSLWSFHLQVLFDLSKTSLDYFDTPNLTKISGGVGLIQGGNVVTLAPQVKDQYTLLDSYPIIFNVSTLIFDIWY